MGKEQHGTKQQSRLDRHSRNRSRSKRRGVAAVVAPPSRTQARLGKRAKAAAITPDGSHLDEKQAPCGSSGSEWRENLFAELSCAVSTRSGRSVLQFYSKSANTAARHLSNFTLAPSPFPVGGVLFPSVEHAFQAGKYKCLVEDAPDRVVAVVTSLAAGGTVASALAARRAGSKSTMKRHGVALDRKRWETRRVEVMFEALRARALVDRQFRTSLELATEHGWQLRHFERSSARSFWGGSFARDTQQWRGRNKLGELLHKVGGELAAKKTSTDSGERK